MLLLGPGPPVSSAQVGDQPDDPCPDRLTERVRRSPPARAWVRAARASGLPVGFYRVLRCDPPPHRPNLTVLPDALTTRVVVVKGRATGVRYLRGRTEETAHAGEVILSAGAIGSPHLLLLSGIGPAAHLREHGIDVILDSPLVGQGLQDHPALSVRWTVRRPAPAQVEAGGFTGAQDSSVPDLLYQVIGSLSVLITSLAEAARGTVALRSADPGDRPLVDTAYRVEDADLPRFLYGIEQLRAIASRRPLTRLISTEEEPGPGRDLRAYVRDRCAPAGDPTSTVAMGPGDAPLEPSLRVRGIGGLRVVDASAMPSAPRGSTGAPTIALAERAAALIVGPRPPG
ncbi:MAG: GMC oxidoreductase [Streptosporangiaceae bacterium]